MYNAVVEKTVEVEVRGSLSKEKYEELIKLLSEKADSKKTKNRILIDYSTFLPHGGIKERTRDIRLRATNGVPEIIVKMGSWGGSENRKEYSVLASKGEFDKLVQIFAAIGLTKGMLCIRKSEVFQYQGIEFALVEVPDHSYYFEAEKMIGQSDEKEMAIQEIEDILKEFKLEQFSHEEFYEYIEKLNKEANEVFDYSSYKENYFKERFDI